MQKEKFRLFGNTFLRLYTLFFEKFFSVPLSKIMLMWSREGFLLGNTVLLPAQ